MSIDKPYAWLEDPGRELPADVAKLTGITDAELAGRTIDDAAAMLSPKALASNATVSVSDVLLAVVRGRLKATGRRADVPGFAGLLFRKSDRHLVLALTQREVLKHVLVTELSWQMGTVSELQRLRLVEMRTRRGVSIKTLPRFRRNG